MSRRQFLFAITLTTTILSGCLGASPTPLPTAPPPASAPIPSNPPAVLQPRPATATARPTSTPEGTPTPGPSPTLPPPIERPFLMRVDRISVVVGRGILLEGRVINGTLITGGGVEILTPTGNIIRPSLIAILIGNTPRNQVVVGDQAGILVGGIEATGLSPGMLLVKAGEFESYQEALLQTR
ncbi:MAG: hypothetical protein R3307_02425 [Anaerolineales bacterium]|nr:hypothetical protein [Anaerolineales bacterium]